MSLAPPSSRRTALATATLLALVVLVYAPSLGNGFVWDDVDLIVANPAVDSLAGVRHYATALHGPYWRPLVFASFAVESALWGRWAPAFHATNLVLHLLNTALVVLLARRTGVALAAALGGAAVFALHPLQVEAVAYVSGRTDLLMTTGALTGALVLLGRRAPLARGIGAAAAAALALLSKESGYAVLVAWPWLFWRRDHGAATRAALLLPTVVVAGLLLALRPGAPALAGDVGVLTRLGAVGEGALTYARLLVWPVGLQVDRLTPLSAPATGVAVAAATVALALFGLRRRGAVSDWTAWTAAFYLPVSNLVPLYPAIADRALFTPEHNLYAPLAGIGVLLALAAARLTATMPSPALRRGAAAAVAIPLVGWALATAVRLPDWHDHGSLFSSALAQGSESPRVWYNAGNALLAAGDAAAAVHVLEGAVARAPTDVAALTNLGVARQRIGDLAGADVAYTRAAQLAPEDALLWENIGSLAVQRRDAVAARDAFARAVALDPSRERSRRALAALDAAMGAAP